MIKYKKYFFSFSLAVIILTGIVSNVYASMTPTFSVSNSLNNGYVQLTVNADPNAPVQLYYYGQNSATSQNIGNIGYTDNNGVLSINVPYAQYNNISPGMYIYVVVDGASSPVVQWPPYLNDIINNNPSAISFSQNNLTINVGQITTVTLYDGSGEYYISGSSNNVASASLNGNELTLSGVAGGSASITVCSNNNSCGDIYVTVVSPSIIYPTYSPSISLGQNSGTLNIGQALSINIYGNGNYYISNNANSYVASASISGSVLSVYANNSGSSNVTVCQSNGSCVTFYVSINPPVTVSYIPPATVYPRSTIYSHWLFPRFSSLFSRDWRRYL